nr:hypothetical protein [Tanacetum cinerariifolium]
GDKSGDDPPIKGRSNNEGEALAERISNDSEDIARVLTSMDAATVLAGEANVPTGSVSTGNEVGPTASPIVQRRKGKEYMEESDTPKKKKLQEQIDAQGMIDSLDKSNETVAKYLQEYQQFASDLSLEKKIELISDLMKYQDHYKKGEGLGTPTEPHHTPSPEVTSSHPSTSSIPLPSIPTAPIPLDRATIAKSFTLPRDSAPRVTSPAAEEGSMQQTMNELTAFCTSLQRQHSELLAKFQAQEVEINRLKERVKLLKDKGVIGDKSGNDAPIKGRSTNEGEGASERISNDSEEIVRVLTSIDAAIVLAWKLIKVGPTASPIVPRRKGKEVMVESDTPKKKKLQEQIDAQVARELEEQQERGYEDE